MTRNSGSAGKSSLSVLLAGIIKENPVFVLILGTCPTLAVSTMASNAIGMGLATMFVLICSNVIISLLKNVIPVQVRIPSYIVMVAALVSVVQLIVKAYTPGLDKALGIFLPLIAVNCIILGRAEMFARKRPVFASFLDGAGMGLGFTLALLIMGSIRELIGSGTWFGIQVLSERIAPMTLMILPAGGFFVYGCVIALINAISKGRAVKRNSFGCKACPAYDGCASHVEED